MARIRSPNYPAMGLPEAIERIGVIHEKEQHLAAPREVMARHLGYNGLNGSSLKSLSALLKYGLMEKTDDDKRKISALAVQILHPRNPAEKMAAIKDAAFRPALFAEIANEWPSGVPSDENLKAYLIHRNFAKDAIPEVIKAFRETMELVTRESGGYSSPSGSSSPPKPGMSPPMPAAARSGATPPPVVILDANVLHVAMSGDRLDVSAALVDAEHVDKLIRILEANKALLPAKKERPHSLEDA